MLNLGNWEKQIIAILCAAALLFTIPGLGTIYVDAATTSETTTKTTTIPKSMAEFVNIVDNRVRNALLTADEETITVDLSDLKFAYSKSRNRVYCLEYLLPYFDDKIELTKIKVVDGCYDHLVIQRGLSKAKTKARIQTIDAEIDAIFDAADVVTTKERKLLVFHDHIVQNTAYDRGYYSNNVTAASYYTSGVLLKNKAVCNGYSHCFQYLCLKSGIDCRVVISENDNHAWNMVKIGKSYYHIDVTWDDPTPDILGRVIHDYFLLTDKQIRGDGHISWTSSNLKCTNTKYKNRYWREIESPVLFTSKYAYFIENKNIVRRNLKTGKEKNVVKNLGVWNIYGSDSYYTNTYSGLILHDNYLYFNTAKKIKKYSLRTGRVSTVVKPNFAGYVYGLNKDGSKLKYVIKKDFYDTGNIKTCKKQLS